MALFESSRGNFIPFFIEEFQTTNSTISFVISFYVFGAIIGGFLGGYICQNYGHKLVYLTGTAVATIAVIMAPFTPSLFYLGLLNFIFGIGRASLSVAIDSMVPVLSIGFEAVLMNITHFMYGFGSLTGQSAIGSMLSTGLSWRTIYFYILIFYIVSVILTLVIKTPNITIKNSEKILNKKELYTNPLVYLFMVAVTLIWVSEAVLNTWFISYIRNTYGFGPADASIYASTFFLLFAIGRLVGGFIINKLGSAKGLQIFMFIGAIVIIIGLILKINGLMFIAVSGFFLSVAFPTLMVILNSIFKENTSIAIGIITMIANIIFVVIFNLLGVLNDLLGSYTAFYIAPLSMIGCCITIMAITKHKIES